MQVDPCQEYVVTLAKYYNIPVPTVDRSLTLSDLPLKSSRKHKEKGYKKIPINTI